MSRKYNEAEKSSKFQTTTNARTNVKRQNEELKQIPQQQNTNNVSFSFKSAGKLLQNVNKKRFTDKEPLGPIVPARSYRQDTSNDADNNEQDFEIVDEGSLPLKLFDGKKQSLSELSEESMSYLWLRRLKEIFLHMADGKDEQEDDPFVEFDMSLAKTDLTNTCDRYIENERLALTKKVIFVK